MIYDYQKEAYQKLFRTAIAHKIAMGKELPVYPRFHKLVIGPSGSGKTHLVKRVAEVLNWRVLTLNMAGWVVLGARESPTWHTVGEWLSESHPDEPQMIILDEIDKVWGQDSWTRYLRAEVYSLVDGLVPPQVIPPNIGGNTFKDAIKQTLIFGCGAFQDAFEVKPSAGFVSTLDVPATSNDLSKHLARELVNRFDSEIVILPDLKHDDYRRMVDEAIPKIPEDIGEIIKRIAPKLIDQAVENKSGARFMESLLSSAYLENVSTIMNIFDRLERAESEIKEDTDKSINKEEVKNSNDEDTIDPLWEVDDFRDDFYIPIK
jgi:SpoVK/Ycf46/Vps4 family AAA+-type ATPase